MSIQNWEEEFYELLADGVGTAEMVDFIKLKLIEQKKETRQETIKKIGQEFKKWFYSDDLKEPIEDAIERITGIKI